MSLFVALRLPDAVVADLAAAHSALPPELAAGYPGLRWVPPQNWHVTVAFLGDLAPGRLADLETRLARAAGRHSPMTLSLGGSGHFGSRVLYVGVGGDRVALERVAASVSAAARRAKVAVEERPYRPHLTLARWRGPTSLHALAEPLADYAGPAWLAGSVDLMESTPLAGPGQSPRYAVKGTFALSKRSR
jgi:2'-5' RNA ligase